MLSRSLLGRPRRLLVCLLVGTVLLVPVIMKRLSLEGNLIDLLPRSSVAAQTFATFTRSLVAGQELVILVTCEDPDRLLSFADAYAEALGKLPDAGQVTYRVSQKAAGYLRDHLLLLLDDQEIDELGRRLQPEALREQVRRLRRLLLMPGGAALGPLYTADPLELLPLVGGRLSSGLPVDTRSGYFRSADGKALLIKLRPGYNPMDWVRDQRLLAQAGALAVSLGGQIAPARPAAATPVVAFTGAYAFPPYYRHWLEQDLTLSTTISVASVLLLFALFFRSLRILPFVLVPLGAAGVWTAAAAALLFGRINAVSIAFGTILVAIGIDLPIQLYNRLREELLRLPPTEAVQATLAALSGPAVVATLGPAAVFFCCGLSDYRGLNELGVLAGVGLCLNCVAMLTLFPCLLLCLPVRLWYGRGTAAADRRRAQAALPGGPLYLLGRVAGRWPRALLCLAAGLLLLGLPAALRLRFDRQLFALEPGQMPPALAQQEIARRFGERQRFLVSLVEDPDPERAAWRADLWLREAERLRRAGRLRGYEALGTLLPSQRTLSERRARLQRLDLGRGARLLEQVLGEEGFDTAPFGAFLAQLRDGPRAPTLEELRGTELGFVAESHLGDLPASGGRPARRVIATYLFAPVDDADEAGGGVVQDLVRLARTEAGGAVTGLPLLQEELLRIVERDTVVLTLSSAALVALLLVLYYRRWRPVLAVLLPLSLAWVLFGAAMRLFHLPLNLYNVLAIPLCIGYGIDDHVFLVHRHEATEPGLRDPVRTLFTTGRAIVLTSLSTMVGFAGLGVAHFPGLRLLGLSGALAVLLCLLSAFAVLPALLALFWPPKR